MLYLLDANVLLPFDAINDATTLFAIHYIYLSTYAFSIIPSGFYFNSA